MQITVSGIDVLIEKKNIKNMHLYVKPPLGKVSVSAPMNVSDKSIENFIRINIGWIKKQQEKYRNQPRMTARQYVSGETYYIWGKQYFLIVNDSQKRFFKIDGNNILLGFSNTTMVDQREKYVREELRKILKIQLDRLIPKWEEKTSLFCDSYNVRYMTTKWGSCNSKARRIWFNLQMVEKPIQCLEYVILHELVHLKIANHGREFMEMMNKFMPDWKDMKKLLNNQILDNYET